MFAKEAGGMVVALVAIMSSIASLPTPRPRDPLYDLRISDAFALLAVARTGSVTSAARELGVTASHVSKAIDRLEAIYRVALVAKAGRGIVLTEDGERISLACERATSELRHQSRPQVTSRELAIAAPSYLASGLVPAIASAIAGARVHAMELHPAAIRAQSASGRFSMALTLGHGPFPSSWSVSDVGSMRSVLLATPQVAASLGSPVDAARIRETPFLCPMRPGAPEVPADDGCPIPLDERTPGHRVDTFGVGLEMAAQTGQLIFGPELTARRYVREGRLVVVDVEGWDVRTPVVFACDDDRVLARDRRAVEDAVRSVFEG
jgi:molybdate transport repressor ModE-like protein